MTRGLYLHHPSSLEHDTGDHPERAARIRAIEQELGGRGWLGLEPQLAPAADRAALEAVHPAAYVDRIAEVSARGGGMLDMDTVASARSFEAALHAAGGAVSAVTALVAREAEIAFCGLRPPGHHAEAARAMGFCLFNNVAVAARYALDRLDVRRVLVLDWDVHHGNGTNDIFYESAEVLYVSIHQSPLYPGTGALTDSGAGAGEGYTVNLPVPPGAGHAEWLGLVEHVVAPIAREYAPDLLLVSAGFDAHRDDPLANCTLTRGVLRRDGRRDAHALARPGRTPGLRAGRRLRPGGAGGVGCSDHRGRAGCARRRPGRAGGARRPRPRPLRPLVAARPARREGS